MSEILFGPKIKLQRARGLLEQLRQIEYRFNMENKPVLVEDRVSVPGRKIFKAVVQNPVPDIVHVLIGEIIYHLRSSLDQIVMASAIASKGNTVGKRDIQFPTAKEKSDFIKICKGKMYKKSRKGSIIGFDCKFKKAILSFKPYDKGNRFIRGVFELANIDRHMELIIARSSGSVRTFSNMRITGLEKIPSSLPSENMIDGIVVANIPLDGIFEGIKNRGMIEVDGRFNIKENPISESNSIIEVLDKMIYWVSVVYLRFRLLITN